MKIQTWPEHYEYILCTLCKECNQDWKSAPQSGVYSFHFFSSWVYISVHKILRLIYCRYSSTVEKAIFPFFVLLFRLLESEKNNHVSLTAINFKKPLYFVVLIFVTVRKEIPSVHKCKRMNLVNTHLFNNTFIKTAILKFGCFFLPNTASWKRQVALFSGP
jgi:hypothetical protein